MIHKLNVYYADGRFRVKVAARLCWGLGTRGAVDFVVDVDKMDQFVRWVAQQLLHASFRKLLFITKDAFKALTQVIFLVIAENTPMGVALKKNSLAVDEFFKDMILANDKANDRSKMVNNINRKQHWIAVLTPEMRGMMLYQITRHSLASHSRNRPATTIESSGVVIHFLPSHKEAILNLLKPVQIVAEWANVMQHMTFDGRRSADAGKNEGDVLRFLNNGYFLAPDLQKVFDDLNNDVKPPPDTDVAKKGNKYLDEYLKLRVPLLDKFPKGYKVAVNGSPAWQVYGQREGQRHPDFAVAAAETLDDAFRNFGTHMS